MADGRELLFPKCKLLSMVFQEEEEWLKFEVSMSTLSKTVAFQIFQKLSKKFQPG